LSLEQLAEGTVTVLQEAIGHGIEVPCQLRQFIVTL